MISDSDQTIGSINLGGLHKAVRRILIAKNIVVAFSIEKDMTIASLATIHRSAFARFMTRYAAQYPDSDLHLGRFLPITQLKSFCSTVGDASIEEVDIPGLDTSNVEHLKLISRALTSHMPSRWKGKGVALIDITRFSAAPAPRQMELKLLLDSAVFDARGSLKKLLRDQDRTAPDRFIRLSSGDGYYLWADSIGPDAAAATFCLLVLTMAHIAYMNDDLIDLRVRGAFAIGEMFLLPYMDLWEKPSQESALYDGIGPVMNGLARILTEARPGQVLLGEFSGIDNEFTKTFSDPVSLLQFAHPVVGTDEAALEITKPGRLRVVDKHGDIYHCHNCAGQVRGWLGAAPFIRRIGLVPDDSCRLGETAFTASG